MKKNTTTNSLAELAKETLTEIIRLRRNGVSVETIRREINKTKDENVKLFLLSGLEALECLPERTK